jgi:23S rRNA (uracil1939-C5)-methyltransferase
MKRKLLPEIDVAIHSLSHDGRGIATINGKTTFVHGALIGETVTCKVTQQHRRYNEGIATEIKIAAPERITAACPHFGICGGCSMQHMNIANQIQFKQQTLLEQLQHFGKVIPESLLEPITGQAWGYRRKARLGVRYVIKKNKLLVGFREKFSNYLADIQSCLVLHPSVGMRITMLAELITSLNQYEHIAQIEVAVGDDATALVFRHLTPLPESDYAKLYEFGKATGLHIYLQPNPPEKIRKLWPEDNNEYLIYALPDYNIIMQFHPLDFTQVNSEINLLMLKQALKLLAPEPEDTILDLFCGLGNFTLPIARYAKQVVGVEGSDVMVKRAEENARSNQIYNTKFYAANLMEPPKEAPWMQQCYDKILLDPPRLGAKEIITHFSTFSAKKIVYVSCNPATLARDAGELVYTHGYKLKQIGVINMFAHTSHIEAIALFEK